MVMIESQMRTQPVKSGLQMKGFTLGSGVNLGGLVEKEQNHEKGKVVSGCGGIGGEKICCPGVSCQSRKMTELDCIMESCIAHHV